MSKPLFSIITPCLNRAEFIETAIQSVKNQSYTPFEHIIVDGGSTDGSLEILKRYPHLQVQIDQDRGMYDALNRGVQKAQGEIIGFLNSDDFYEKRVLLKIAETMLKDTDLDAVSCGAKIIKRNKSGKTHIIDKKFAIQNNDLVETLTVGVPIFNAWFFRRRVFEKNQPFNQNYSYAADRDFLIQLMLHNFKYQPLNMIAYNYCIHSGSLTFGDDSQKYIEFTSENLLIAEDFLKRRPLSPYFWKSLIKMHDYYSTEIIIKKIKQKKFLSSLSDFHKAWKINNRWPFNFITALLPRSIKYIIGNHKLKND